MGARTLYRELGLLDSPGRLDLPFSNQADGWGVWARSDMETYSTWTSDLSPVLDFDIREPGVHGEKGAEWVTEYLVGCHSSASSGGLRVN
jgi:hypothetical protein